MMRLDITEGTAFTAAAEDAVETFSGNEGTVLFTLAVAGILAVTVILILSARFHARCVKQLDRLETQMEKEAGR